MGLFQIVYWTAWLLGLILAALIFYFLVRTAVVHALRRHYYWVKEQEQER